MRKLTKQELAQKIEDGLQKAKEAWQCAKTNSDMHQVCLEISGAYAAAVELDYRLRRNGSR